MGPRTNCWTPKGLPPQNRDNIPRKNSENQIKEALELLEKWDGCVGKVSSAIGTPPSTLKAWAALAIIDRSGPLSHDESYKEHME